MVPGLSHLKHVVVLMMGGRSFDHMLGYMPLDGLTGNETNPDSNGLEQKVQPTATSQGGVFVAPDTSWEGVNIQVFGNPQGTGEDSPKMRGFIKSFFTKVGDVNRSRLVMDCFNPSSLPVLTYLAQQYAVCDRWFSSLPGPTVPNRLFAHFGTSFGDVSNSMKFDDNGKSVYSRLLSAGQSTKIYYFDEQSGSVGLTFLLQNQPKTAGTYSDFRSDCATGNLPTYSFVEPNNSDHTNYRGSLFASDQRAGHDVVAGENFIADVYNHIRQSPLWESTLLLILYEHHGGMYDHVPPPQIPPDGVVDPVSGFRFDRLGIRVPAIFVSPWIRQGTIIHTQYEHASIPATLASFFVADHAQRNLTVREQRANLFTSDPNLLTLTSARQDSFYFQPSQPTAMIMSGTTAASADGSAPREISIPVPLPDAYLSRPLSVLLRDHLRDLNKLEQTLPSEQRTNIDVDRIRTEGEASEYSRRVILLLGGSLKRPKPSKPRAQDLIEQFNATLPGRSDASKFGQLCVNSVKYLFGDDLAGQLRPEAKIEDGFQYMDLLARLSPREGAGFWSWLAQDFRCRYIVFEFKNYANPISQNQIYTTSKYLYPSALRPVAIVIARMGSDDGAKRAIRGELRGDGKVLIVLTLEELFELLRAKEAGVKPSDLMEEHLERLLSTLIP
jgi:phospholipase C